MKINKINDNNFSQIAQQCKKPLLIKFYNPNCHLCDGLKPIFKQICSSFSNDYEFGVVNAVESKKLTGFFKITGVPHLFVVFNSDMVEIPYPQNPDPETGYSFYDIADFLHSYKTKIKR